MCRDRTCTAFTTNTAGRCDDHQSQHQRAYNDQTSYYRSPEWKQLRDACLARDYNQCVACTGTNRLTAHHLKPRAEGGADVLDNLLTLCGSCHSRLERGDHDVRAIINQHLTTTRNA
jgi:5-methylcytosine-specific restriction protein A